MINKSLKQTTTFFLLMIALFLAFTSTESFCKPLPIESLNNNSSIRINYFRQDQSYKDYGLWVWDDVLTHSSAWPKGALPFSETNDGRAYVDVKLKPDAKVIGFLIVNRTNGKKDAGNKEFIIKTNMEQIYTKENDNKIYSSDDFDMEYKIVGATIESLETIVLNFNTRPSMPSSSILDKIELFDADKNKVEIKSLVHQKDSKYLLKAKIDPAKTPLVVTFSEQPVLALKSWKLIDKLYAYDGDDLGCTHNNKTFTLKLWAPRASQVRIFIYSKENQNKLITKLEMVKGEKAVWQINLDSSKLPNHDLNGCYYQYEVTNHGELPKIILDPYAKSMAPVTISPAGDSSGSANDFIGKAAFVIPSSLGAKNVPAKIENYTKREDAIIYEVHVRDFTSDPSLKDKLTNRWGSFKAFTEKLSYIKSLGVTHVQLLPVMAWYYGDETKMNQRELDYCAKNNQYNWGYDPHNYFSPDGAYSSRPEVAKERIIELKYLINEIHKAGMGVILDVVYTHMASSRFLNDIVPDYYFFKNPEGGFLGDFGNNLATNRKMAEKLMIDSVKYWFKEYGIDGMRWDMMGDATAESVQNAFDAAKIINPKCIFIGEGWRTFKGHIEDATLAGKGADQDWMASTNDVGVFSDEMRNELKSGFGCEGEPRFLTGGKRDIQSIFRNIKAQPNNTPANAPGDMVQYIAAHDNLPLYDVIAQSIKKDPEIPENDLEIHQRVRIGNALVLTSQGTSFIHAGQEYGRTKQWLASGKPEDKYHEFVDANGKLFKHPYFVHDSYDSSDAINMFDWEKATNGQKFPNSATTRKYSTGLIALRKSSDAFRLSSQALVNSNVKLLSAPEIQEHDLLIAYECKSTSNQRFIVVINADNKVREVTIKDKFSSAELIVDKVKAGITKIETPNGVSIEGSKIVLDALTVAIFRWEKK